MPNTQKPKRPRAPKGPPGPINAVLSENLRRIIEYQGMNPSSWAKATGADKKQVQRALGTSNSPTLDTVAAIASAAKLHPWQLLIPNLDPRNPPVFMMTRTEKELYSKIKQDFMSLPTPNGGGG